MAPTWLLQLPIGHLTQVSALLCPLRPLQVPAGHLWHSESPAALQVPSGQIMQGAPRTSETMKRPKKADPEGKTGGHRPQKVAFALKTSDFPLKSVEIPGFSAPRRACRSQDRMPR